MTVLGRRSAAGDGTGARGAPAVTAVPGPPVVPGGPAPLRESPLLLVDRPARPAGAPNGNGNGHAAAAPPLHVAPLPTAVAPVSAPDAGAATTGVAPATALTEVATAPAPAPKPRQKPPPLAVVPKSTRPHGRLGFLWVGLTVAAVLGGVATAGAWLGLCAGVAGMQTARVWRGRNEKPLLSLAAGSAAALPVCAIWGLRGMTGAIVGAVVATLLARLFSVTKAPARDVGLTLAIGVVIGLAAASVVLLRSLDIQAPLLLLAFAAAYDAGAYLVGTGASSAWEGPAAGVATLIPVTMLSAVILVPPFPDGSPLLLGLLAAVLAPCGPLVGSALLGERDASASALRRLDSLLVLAPVWAWVAAAFLR
jgi:hypothetical protein